MTDLTVTDLAFVALAYLAAISIGITAFRWLMQYAAYRAKKIHDREENRHG